MANKEDHEEHPPRGNEWEVVSLTSSAYAAAAAPGPYDVESRDAWKYDTYYGAATSRDLYMSDHFVFPPSEHENLPIDEHLFEEEQRKDDESYSHMESAGSESAMYDHRLLDADPNEYAEGNLDLHSDVESEKDAKKSTHNLPCEAWWRRRVISKYSRTREAKAIWSLFFAAAVTGLVVLGQRWQQERWQVLQLKWQSSISSEKLSRVLEPLSRLKDVIVRSNPQVSAIRSSSSSAM